MRHYLLFSALALFCALNFIRAEDPSNPSDAHPAADCSKSFDEAHQFIFFAVLEGLYQDGLTNGDVNQIMKRDEKGGLEHFIYGCPICHPAIHALEAYQSRPNMFSGLKGSCSNFGSGLNETDKKNLYSEKPEERMTAVNALVLSWTTRRMSQLNWPPERLAALKASLEHKRQQGMKGLETMTGVPEWKARYATFAKVGACPACNGAVGLTLPEIKKEGVKDKF